jgi:hypothetical protein
MAGAVLLLKIAPLFGELAAKEVVPANGSLLLKQLLILWWIGGDVDAF